jgi:hypothetical protein
MTVSKYIQRVVHLHTFPPRDIFALPAEALAPPIIHFCVWDTRVFIFGFCCCKRSQCLFLLMDARWRVLRIAGQRQTCTSTCTAFFFIVSRHIFGRPRWLISRWYRCWITASEGSEGICGNCTSSAVTASYNLGASFLSLG